MMHEVCQYNQTLTAKPWFTAYLHACDLDGKSMYIWIAKYFIATFDYHQFSNISRTLGNKFVEYSDLVGASPVGAAPTTSSFLT